MGFWDKMWKKVKKGGKIAEKIGDIAVDSGKLVSETTLDIADEANKIQDKESMTKTSAKRKS